MSGAWTSWAGKSEEIRVACCVFFLRDDALDHINSDSEANRAPSARPLPESLCQNDLELTKSCSELVAPRMVLTRGGLRLAACGRHREVARWARARDIFCAFRIAQLALHWVAQ